MLRIKFKFNVLALTFLANKKYSYFRLYIHLKNLTDYIDDKLINPFK